VKNDDDAKDIAQRAFVKAFQSLESLRGAGAFRTWVYRIASNLSMNHLRDHARLQSDSEAGVNVPVEAIGGARLVEAEDQVRLRAAIETLPPKQRQVLELRVYQELSFKEVADIAGCTENTAKVNFHHAVKKLRACMDEDLK
jgi:RNA polymerase sigma-70 factor, ECF subfamily